MPVAEMAAVAASSASRCTVTRSRRSGRSRSTSRPPACGDEPHRAQVRRAHRVGALLLRRDTACVPLLHGGGQERDVRSGTLDVAGAVAMAVAADIAVGAQTDKAAALSDLRDRLIDGVLSSIADTRLNGAVGSAGCRATRTSPSGAARVTRC